MVLLVKKITSLFCYIFNLGFCSIQSLMHKKMSKSINKLVEAVEEAFNELHPKILSNVYTSL